MYLPFNQNLQEIFYSLTLEMLSHNEIVIHSWYSWLWGPQVKMHQITKPTHVTLLMHLLHSITYMYVFLNVGATWSQEANFFFLTNEATKSIMG